MKARPPTKRKPRPPVAATGEESNMVIRPKCNSDHPAVKQMLTRGLSRSVIIVASIGDCFGGGTGWDRETFADFSCPICKQRVEKKLKSITGSPFVMAFLGCGCPGAVAHLTGDPGPGNARAWKRALKRLRAQKSDLLVLNVNPKISTPWN